MMACVVLGLAGCAAPHPNSQPVAYSGGDGSSCGKAVRILQAQHREDGMLGEQLWLDQNCAGYQKTSQADLESGGRHYEVFELATTHGQTRKVYFDTTDFINR